MPTVSEKILARASDKSSVKPGEIVDAHVDVAMTHEACVQVIDSFRAMGADKIWDAKKVVVIIDHWAPAPDEKSAIMHQKIRTFVKEHGLKNFYDVGYGICHQVLAEDGYIKPGNLVVGTDSHTNTGGALGAFSIGIGPTEMAAVFATAKLWLKVPHTINLILDSRTGSRVVAKDIILHIIGKLGSDGAIYKAIEFNGQGAKDMSIADRMTLTNMTTEMGAKTGIVPSDEKTIKYLVDVGAESDMKLSSDEDAVYQEEYRFDLGKIEPQVACPHNVDNVKPVGELKNVKIDQGFIGSCTNGRIEDLRAVAEILKGEKVSKDARLIVSPASAKIYAQALKEGIMETLLDAGAVICNSNCAACFGGHMGILAKGEVCISSSNRNFIGRMGSKDSRVYLASPYTVAASALYGEITDPRGV